MKYVIFTDLDETLLDKYTYDFSAAEDSLNLIKEKGYPLIFVTSKTRSEVLILQKKIIGKKYPFVVENGGGLFLFKLNKNYLNESLDIIDNLYVKIFGKKYDEIRKIFKELQRIAPINGFGDMDDKDIAKITKLPLNKVILAKKRDFTEPFILEGDERKFSEILQKEAKKYGTKIVKGGKFYHLIGENQSKGKAVRFLIDFYKNKFGDIRTIGLGDSENDIEFLKEVDVPIIIRKENGEYLELDIENVIVSKHPSTKGWNEVIMRLLK